jgi:hypothetical protein
VVGSRIGLVFLAASGVVHSGEDVAWDWQALPITVEALKDVPVLSSGYGNAVRGSLYAAQSFDIKAGERFVVTKLLREGACNVRFRGKVYMIYSCPWMEGFVDHQRDIFRIVKVGGGK